jgi:uncharacterized protein YdbL (DUF1318 family)
MNSSRLFHFLLLCLCLLLPLLLYSQPAPLPPENPVTPDQPPPVVNAAQTSSDVRLQQLWERMKDRVSTVDSLLLQGRAGEGLDGFLIPPPGANLSDEEKTWIDEENVLRGKVFEEMAALTGAQPQDMAAQRAQRYIPRLKKGIFRQVRSPSGSVEWGDGYTDEERLQTYTLSFFATPPERVEATKAFSVGLQVSDSLGRPATHFSLDGVSFSVASGKPSDGLMGQTLVPLVNGMVQFTGLAFPDVIPPTKLYFKGQGLLQHLKIQTPELSVLEKTLSPEDIEFSLPAWQRRADRLLKLPPSPSRDRELNDFRRSLESAIASIKSFPTAKPSTAQSLTSLHAQVHTALELDPPGAANPPPR